MLYRKKENVEASSVVGVQLALFLWIPINLFVEFINVDQFIGYWIECGGMLLAYADRRNTVSSMTSWAIVIHMIQNHWTVTLFYVLPHSLSSADKTTEPLVPCGFHVTEVFYFERLTWFSGIKESLCSGSEFLPRAEKTKPPFNRGLPSCTVSWNILTILYLKSLSHLFLWVFELTEIVTGLFPFCKPSWLDLYSIMLGQYYSLDLIQLPRPP